MRKTLALLLVIALAGACKKDAKPSSGEAAKKEEPGKAEAPAATPPPAAEGIKLTRKVPTVGAKMETTDNLVTEFTITPPGKGPVAMRMEKDENRHVEVVEVSGEAMQKVKVKYAVKKERRASGPKVDDKVSALQGKSYVVWSEAGAIKATTEAGKPISKEELAELEGDWKGELGSPPEMETLLAGRTWKQGEKVTLSAAELASLNKERPDTTAKSGTVTLTAIDGPIATFGLEMDIEQKEKQGTLMMPMKITVKLDTTTTWPQDLQMDGTLEGVMQGMQAKGTLKGSKTYKY